MGRGFCLVGNGRRIAQWSAVALASCALAQCTAQNKFGRIDPKYGVAASPRVVEPGQPVPKGGGRYSIGKPYTVAGRVYTPVEDPNYRASGVASWYGDDFHGRRTANGEVFDMESISAAHPTMPLPSYARVTNLETHKSLVVRVNDRGPYHGNRVIDVSVRAAKLLGFHGNGLAKVQVEYVGRAPLEGSDDRQLVATLRSDGPAAIPSAVRVAGASSFVPNLDDAEPSRGSRHVADGSVKLPPQRPYRLGERGEDTPTASTPAATRSTAAAAPRGRMAVQNVAPSAAQPAARPVAQNLAAQSLDQQRLAMPVASRGNALQPSLTSPVSAFSASRYDHAPSVVNGRGLY